MTLASTKAAVAADISDALAALPRGEDQSAAAWVIILDKIATWIAAEGKATLPAASVVTTGNAATQTGPAAPVLLSIT